MRRKGGRSTRFDSRQSFSGGVCPGWRWPRGEDLLANEPHSPVFIDDVSKPNFWTRRCQNTRAPSSIGVVEPAAGGVECGGRALCASSIPACDRPSSNSRSMLGPWVRATGRGWPSWPSRNRVRGAEWCRVHDPSRRTRVLNRGRCRIRPSPHYRGRDVGPGPPDPPRAARPSAASAR